MANETTVTLTIDRMAYDALRRAISKEMIWNTSKVFDAETQECLKVGYQEAHDNLAQILKTIDSVPTPEYQI